MPIMFPFVLDFPQDTLKGLFSSFEECLKLEDGHKVKSERGFLIIPKSDEAMKFLQQRTEKIMN